MKRPGPTIMPLAPAHLTWLGAVQAAALLALIDVRWSLAPLAGFLLLCAAAPFCYRLGFFLPIVSHGSRDRRAVSLTFDDGPDPAVTPQLLELLSRHGVRAAFFVTGEGAARHPTIVTDLLSRGHAIGNHSYHHDPLLMLQSTEVLEREVLLAQSQLESHGITPLAFRPPVGITNPRLWRVLIDAGMFCCTFSCRAGDRGNRRVRGIARRLLRRAGPGDIILLHDVRPQRADVSQWLAEVDELIVGLHARELAIIPLDEMIGRPVMDLRRPVNQAQVFYDAIAGEYDREMSHPGSTVHRQAERIVASELFPLLTADSRVLEIGAGTGRFTMELSRRCRAVTAVDLSPRMLALLAERCRRDGITNVSTIVSTAEDLTLNGRFDIICSFSAIEYIADLPALMAVLSPLLTSDGILYLLTAHTSFPRFFSQVGNALRQGIWLHSRTRSGLQRTLEGAGFTVRTMAVHGLTLGPLGGIIITASAKHRTESR